MSATQRSPRRPVLGRPGNGPVSGSFLVVARRRVGSYLSITLAGAEIAERAEPGQFLNVAVETPRSLLRRPFSVYRTSRQGPWAGTVEFVLDPHGSGTGWLAEREVNDTLDVVGPLGRQFTFPDPKGPCLLVGGGYGAAPLFFLAERLQAHGVRVDMIVGAATEERVFNAMEAKRMTSSVTFTTEDGSLGVQGRVTDVFDGVARDYSSGTVYACGPMPMLRAVAQRCIALNLPYQAAVEEHMACGVGVCWTCVVPVRTPHGVRMVRSCVDGPVLDGRRIAWEESRWAREPAQPAFLPSTTTSTAKTTSSGGNGGSTTRR